MKKKAVKRVDKAIRKWERAKNSGKKMHAKKALRMLSGVRKMVEKW